MGLALVISLQMVPLQSIMHELEECCVEDTHYSVVHARAVDQEF